MFCSFRYKNKLMKKENYLIILLLILTSFTSCKKENLAYENAYNKSYRTWTSFKKSSNNSYRYTIEFGSWTGYSTTTVLTVSGGKVVKRSYVRSTERPLNQTTIIEQWDEEGTTLNTHQTGYPIQTLDEIYQKAKTEWLPKRTDATTYFESNNSGMISSCGYVENNCADDCFNGVQITSIERL